MKVPKGTEIIALDENKTLISEGDWGEGVSSVIDFSAKYTTPAGITPNGDVVYGNRGFSYKDIGVKWDFVK